MRKKITTIGNSAAIVLSKDVLSIMGVEVGDEVDISFIDRTLVVRPICAIEERKKVADAIDKTFKDPDHRELMKRLAK